MRDNSHRGVSVRQNVGKCTPPKMQQTLSTTTVLNLIVPLLYSELMLSTTHVISQTDEPLECRHSLRGVSL